MSLCFVSVPNQLILNFSLYIFVKTECELIDIFLVYPSLDNSDDEEIHIFKPRGRSKIDEAWNPKARVGPLLPKMNRPTREGTKKQAVEKVLEAAAAKRATETPEKVLFSRLKCNISNKCVVF